jgi:anti-sigma B factor antagonist
VVTASGEVDLYTSPRLREAVMGAVTDRSPSVVVDVSGVTYMDSSGIATLVEALKATEKRRGRLVLAGLTPRVREVFELARLQTVFTIVADVEAAVRAASGGPPA